ncbi:hypothetical protein [Streptomyces sp. NPDC059491]|uniref:hypothetical protein n=1 Tax=Streptomyces sp. NPDC059491 TaxID=3346850 RepID=UPI0036959AD0
MPILIASTLALTGCGRLTVMPPPEGVPVVLKPAELTTTWTDADGGTLTLKPDGTFVADDVCIAYRWDEGLTGSGKGTWARGSNKTQSIIHVIFDVAHPETGEREPDAYAALRHHKVLKLWTAVGDPDNDYPNCVLTSPAS